MTTKANILVDAIIRLMHDYPDQWRFGTHTAEHDLSGIRVWHANRLYGVEVLMHSSTILGGVTGWSSILGPFLRLTWRQRLVDAIDAHLSPAGTIDNAIAALENTP